MILLRKRFTTAGFVLLVFFIFSKFKFLYLGQNREVMSSLSIYELLRQNNMFPSANQMKELSEILRPHKENYE